MASKQINSTGLEQVCHVEKTIVLEPGISVLEIILVT